MQRLVVGTIMAGLLALATVAEAQQTSRPRGTVTALGAEQLTLTTAQGEAVEIALGPKLTVMEVGRIDPKSIQSGAFVGIGASPRQPDGSFKAVQIVVFPESMRGTGEGHRDWGNVPSGTMTNAPVTATVTGNAGPRITLALGDKSFDFEVPADATVVAMEPVSRDMLKVGAKIVANARAGEGGKLSTERVLVGKNGEAPPL